MTSISYADVRGVLGKPSSEVSDSDLTPWKGIAEGVVTDELDPEATLPDDQNALDDTAALLAAAYYTQRGTVTQLSQDNRQLTYSDGDMGYWRVAQQRDPTDLLGTLDLVNNTSRYVGST